MDLNPHLLQGPMRFMHNEDYKDFIFDLIEEYAKWDQYHKLEELMGFEKTMRMRNGILNDMVIDVHYTTDEDPEY